MPLFFRHGFRDGPLVTARTTDYNNGLGRQPVLAMA